MFIIFRYPIYHIPMGRTIKDLSTCFLTYHTLSSSFQGILHAHVCLCCFNELYSCLYYFYLPKAPYTNDICLWNMRWGCLCPCRYGPWRWSWVRRKKEKGRGWNLSSTIWFGHLQDARKRVGLGQLWPGPGAAGVASERGGFMAKATKGLSPAPWLQLLHGDQTWGLTNILFLFDLWFCAFGWSFRPSSVRIVVYTSCLWASLTGLLRSRLYVNATWP